MAVLIETSWSLPGADRGNARVTTAILPSGKVLTRNDDEAPFGSVRSDLESALESHQSRGLSEVQMFKAIDLEFASMWGVFNLIEDPKEARDIIKKAGLTATVTPRERSEYRDGQKSLDE